MRSEPFSTSIPQTNFLSPPHPTRPAPLGNTSNPNRASNTNRSGIPFSSNVGTNILQPPNKPLSQQQFGTVTSSARHQRQASAGLGSGQRFSFPPSLTATSKNINGRSSTNQLQNQFEYQEPTCLDRTRNFVRNFSVWVKSILERLASVPFLFALANYFLPFCFEIALLAIHFDELHKLPADTPFLGWSWFPRLRSFVVADAIIGTLLLAKFVFALTVTVFTEGTRVWRSLLSLNGILSIVILPMMMYPGFADGAGAFQASHVSSTSREVWKQSVGKITTSTLDKMQSGELLFSVPSVVAWRIWIVYDIIQTLIFASSNASKSLRAIVYQLSFIFTLFFNCMSTMQLIFCVERGAFLDLGTSFYFTAVTLTTVGYGDFVPTSPLGRAFIITQIVAAMLAVPLLLAETDRLLRFLSSLTGYAGSDRHIIIFGELTDSEMDQLLAERWYGDGSTDPLHIVFVANKFSQETHDKVAASPQPHTMTLCLANQLSRTELLRFSPGRADAALFFSNTQAAAMRGDYRTIAAAASVRLHHPSLPQYLMMRRTDTAHLVEGAFVVFDRDFLRAALLGTSLQIPGFLPMFLNLIRHVPGKDLGKDPMLREYRKRQKEVDDLEEEEKRRIEEEEEENKRSGGGGAGRAGAGGAGGQVVGGVGPSFRRSLADEARAKMKKAKELFRQFQQQQQQQFATTAPKKKKKKYSFLAQFQQRRSPHQQKPKTREEEEQIESSNINNQSWYNMYLNGAKQNIYTIAVPEVLVGRTFVVASFIVQLRTGALPIGIVRDSKVALNAGNTPITGSDSFIVIHTSWEELNTSFANFPTTSANVDTAVTKMALRAKEFHFETEHHATATALWLANYKNYFPFQNHVVLVDLAMYVSQPELCPEESYQREQFQVQDMIALASRFPKWQSFVLLSSNPVSELLQQEWAASGRQAIFHIMKSPLDPEALKLCHIGTCMSVLIFSSLHVSSDNDDNFRSAMLTVNRQVMAAVQVETAGKMKHTNLSLPTGSNGGGDNDNNNENADDDSKEKKASSTSSSTMTQHKQNQDQDYRHPTVITVIGNPNEALLLSPEHVGFQGESIEHDSHCCAFATGCALSPTILDGLMFRTYYNEYLPQIVELLLEPGSVARERASVLAPALFDDELDTAVKNREKDHTNEKNAKKRKKRSNQENSTNISETEMSEDQHTGNRRGRGTRFRFSNKHGKRRDTADGDSSYEVDDDDEEGVNDNDDDDDGAADSPDKSSSSDDSNDNEDDADGDDDVNIRGRGTKGSKRRSSSLYHDFGDGRLPTFGQFCRVMTAGRLICFGFSRVIRTPERGVDTLGKVFMVTNPELATLILPDDYMFILPPWSHERLSHEFFI